MKKTIDELTISLSKNMSNFMLKNKLSKSQANISFFENGAIQMDFGKSVPEKVKKAALEWAKRKGLKAVEATLAKGQNQPESYIFGKEIEDSKLLSTKTWNF